MSEKEFRDIKYLVDELNVIDNYLYGVNKRIKDSRQIANDMFDSLTKDKPLDVATAIVNLDSAFALVNQAQVLIRQAQKGLEL